MNGFCYPKKRLDIYGAAYHFLHGETSLQRYGTTLYTLMTTTKSGVLFLCTFRDLKRLCEYAGVSGYLLFAFCFLPFCPYCPISPCILFSCSFSLCFRMIVSLSTSFWPYLISLKMFDIWRRVYSRCLSFFLYVPTFMMRYVFDVFTFNGSFLYLPCQQRMAHSKDYFPLMTDIIADSLYSTISNLLCLQLPSGFMSYVTLF